MFSCTICLPKTYIMSEVFSFIGHLPIMACFKGEGKHIHFSTVQIMYARILVRSVVLSFVTVMGLDDTIRRKICKRYCMVHGGVQFWELLSLRLVAVQIIRS